MTRSNRLAFASVVFALVSEVAFAGAAARAYQHADFRIVFPPGSLEPVESASPMSDPSVTAHQIAAVRGDDVCLVWYADLAAPGIHLDPDGVFDQSTSALSGKSEIESATRFTRASHRAIRIVYKKTQEGIDVFLRQEAIPVEGRLYQLSCATLERAGLDRPEITAFFDSFALNAPSTALAEDSAIAETAAAVSSLLDGTTRLSEGLWRDASGVLHPTAGYEWVAPDDPKNLEVRLKEGLARGEAGRVTPARGYRWANPSDPEDLTVQRIDELAVTEMRFYEGGAEGVPYGERLYAQRFAKAGTRYVWIELTGPHPTAGRDFSTKISCNCTAASGQSIGDTSIKAEIGAGWTSGYRYWLSLGWKEPGRWPSGEVRVVCNADGREIATGVFTIVGE